jgi:hypothetical protein
MGARIIKTLLTYFPENIALSEEPMLWSLMTTLLFVFLMCLFYFAALWHNQSPSDLAYVEQPKRQPEIIAS